MATIYKEFEVNAPAQFVWEAIKDVGAVYTRLAKGFVTDTVLEQDVRTVTFANGFVVREQNERSHTTASPYIRYPVDGPYICS